MGDIQTMEALAHYTRGIVTLFFIMQAVSLYKERNKSRILSMLFFGLACMAACYLKDIVLLFDVVKTSTRVSALISLVDMICIPIGTTLFIELARPNYITRTKAAVPFIIQLLFIPLFLVFPIREILLAAFIFAALQILYTLVTVIYYTVKYNTYIEENYSWHDNINVKWVRRTCIIYFLLYTGYALAFVRATWLSDVFYNIFCLALWAILIHYTKRHEVVDVSEIEEEETADAEPPVTAAEEKTTAKDEKIYEMISLRLPQCMEQDKIYLNPKVSINDLALAVGTNKSYLSEYINHILDRTFYDYINDFRIREACAIINAMKETGQITMTEVSQKSGFNSLSSFNRYFIKAKGMTPKKYSMLGE